MTVVPGVWKRDFYQTNHDNTALTSCVGPDSLQGPGVFRRVTNQSWTQAGSFGVGVSSNGASGTFTGNATVKQTDSTSRQVNQSWWNTTSGNKKLCGQRNPNLALPINVGLVVAKA